MTHKVEAVNVNEWLAGLSESSELECKLAVGATVKAQCRNLYGKPIARLLIPMVALFCWVSKRNHEVALLLRVFKTLKRSSWTYLTP